MKLADALVSTLRDWNLRYVFGVGGANIEHVYDAAHRLGGDRFQVVCAKSEIGAAMMADARARTHGSLGVCCATSGGGMMNLAVGVAESFAESVPVLAIVGQPPTSLHGRGAFQDSSGIGRSVNAERLWSAITKYRATILDPGQFWNDLGAAVFAALNRRPGPAVLMIPRDLYDADVGQRPDWLPDQLRGFVRSRPVSHKAVAELFDAIHAARTPVLLLGGGVERCAHPGAVTEFARRLQVRVATTLSSKHCFPNDDPLYIGMVGVAGEPSVHRFLTQEADLIVAVGTDLAAMTSLPIREALQTRCLAVVHAETGQALRVVHPTIAIEADEGVVFAKLNELAAGIASPPATPPTLSRRRYTARLAPEVPGEGLSFAAGRQRDDLLQSEALEILQAYLPTTGTMVFDAGNCAAAALHYLQIPRQARTTIALGMGGMGYSIPAAVGAQLGAASGQRTMVFCGDGAFLMLGAEVNTAAHYQLPILFVVFNNGKHGMCVTRQQLYFEGRIEGSTYPVVSIADMARGLGSSPDQLWVGSAGTADELHHHLWAYHQRAEGPGVLELRINREQIPPFTPFLSADAPTYEAPRLVGFPHALSSECV